MTPRRLRVLYGAPGAEQITNMEAEKTNRHKGAAIRWARAMSQRVPGVQYIGLVGSKTADGVMYAFEDSRAVAP